MIFGKKLCNFWSKLRTDHTSGITLPIPVQPDIPESRIPVPSTATPTTSQEPNQTIHSPPVPQVGQGHILSHESPHFFEGAKGFVLNNPNIGVNQQIQFNHHSPSPPSHERQDPVDQEGFRAGLSQDSFSHVPGNIGLGGPSFIAHKQTVHYHSQYGRQRVLEKIQEHSIPGAMFNSDERDQPPRCHPNTRVLIRQRLKVRIENNSLETRIIWMHGPAGVGKSAIMQTIVEELPLHVLRGTLFFSRPNQRYDAKKAFATLAYGVAVDNPEYLQYIGMRLEKDPMFLKTSLDNQFKSLFITPFVDNHVKTGSQRWAMFLDGLDECQNTEESENQSRIFNMIRDSVLHHAKSTPFLWIIASRPEHNLQQAWSRTKHQFWNRTSELWEEDVPINSDQATKDVEVFLHAEFKKIKSDHSDSIPKNLRWPSDSQFVKIAKKSSGLFVFGSTVTKYVSQGDPIARLELIVSLIAQIEQRPTATSHNPFYPLDTLYSRIMEDVTEDLLPTAKSLLGFYLLLDTVIVPRYTWTKSEIIGVVEACNILGFQQSQAYSALRHLRSVLTYPPPDVAQEEPIQFFHASFSDFLVDSSRSQKYHVNRNQELTSIWRRYTQIMKQSATSRGHSEIKISWLPGDDASNQNDLQEKLLWKAQDGWINILLNNSSSQSNSGSRPQVDVSELIEAFQSLGLQFLSSLKFPLARFLDWLDNRAPEEIREMLISERLTLHQLDTERLFKSLCTTPRYRYATHSHIKDISLEDPIGDLDPSHWVYAKLHLWTPVGVFRELIDPLNLRTVPVTVIGVGSSERCAIVGPVGRLGVRATGYYYILPYSVAAADIAQG